MSDERHNIRSRILELEVTATPDGDSSEDAKLVTLGYRLEAIRKRLAPVRAEHRRLWEEAERYARWQSSFEPGADDNPPGTCESYLAAQAQFGARSGLDACDRKLEALYFELDPVMGEIMRTPATTAAGLRAKVLAAMEANQRLWDEPMADLDYDKRALRSLIEAACVVVGVCVPEDCCPAEDEASDSACYDDANPGSAALN